MEIVTSKFTTYSYEDENKFKENVEDCAIKKCIMGKRRTIEKYERIKQI